MKFEWKYIFIHEKACENVVGENVGHFFQREMMVVYLREMVGGLSKPLLLVGHGWVVRVAIKWVELIVIKVKTDIAMSVVVLWNVIILTTFSSLSAQEAVILTTFGAASDANFLERPHVYFSGQLGKFLSDIAPWWHYRGTICNSQKFWPLSAITLICVNYGIVHQNLRSQVETFFCGFDQHISFIFLKFKRKLNGQCLHYMFTLNNAAFDEAPKLEQYNKNYALWPMYTFSYRG